jgi:hypothetical protein
MSSPSGIAAHGHVGLGHFSVTGKEGDGGFLGDEVGTLMLLRVAVSVDNCLAGLRNMIRDAIEVLRHGRENIFVATVAIMEYGRDQPAGSDYIAGKQRWKEKKGAVVYSLRVLYGICQKAAQGEIISFRHGCAGVAEATSLVCGKYARPQLSYRPTSGWGIYSSYSFDATTSTIPLLESQLQAPIPFHTASSMSKPRISQQ